MATASHAESGSRTESESERVSGSDAESGSNAKSGSSSPSVADRLETVARIIWWSFLALVVVFTLIPVVALWFGAVPFDPPPTTPYFVIVGFTLVGAAALIAAGIYDV